MSVRRSFLSRRIASLSFTLSKSFKEFKSIEISQTEPQQSSNCRDDDDDDDDGNGDRVVESSEGSWSTMLPEILGEIIKRVEASEDKWPLRQNVVACGCVCKKWREVTRAIVNSPLQDGRITFPSCLKQV